MYTQEEITQTACYAVLPDKRLNKRLQKILMQLDGKLEESIPSAMANKGQSKAYYRFINHEGVEVCALRQANQQQVLQAASQQKVILAIQDTTQLDFTGKRSAKTLGVLSYPHQKGLFLHNHLLLTEQGEAIGLFDQQFFEREPAQLGHSRQRRNEPFEQKESFRWLQQFNHLQEAFQDQPDQQVIQICDREADIYELLQGRTKANVDYIIRSRQDRCSPPAEASAGGLYESIYQQITAEQSRFAYELEVDHPQHGKRLAHLQVRYCQVLLKPAYRPKGQPQLEPLKLWLVETREVDPPAGVEALCWRLFTSLTVQDDGTAQDIIRYYTYRWRIERFHFVLKQGAQVEKLQLEQVEPLKKAIILYSWIALKVLQSQHLLQNQPQAPLTSIGMSELDDLIVYHYLKSKAVKLPAKSPRPTLAEWVALLAQTMGSKLTQDHSLGVVTLWRAYHKFLLIREAYFAFKDVGNQ